MEATQLARADKKALSRFLKPHHLDAERFTTYRDTYRAGKLKAIHIDDVLKDEVAEQLYEFMRSESVFRRRYGLYPDREVSEEEWERAADEQRLYTFLRLEGVRKNVRSFNPMVYTRFREMVADDAFISFLRQFTTDELTVLQSFAGTAYGPGDFLRPHDDVAADRKLAYIFYLNPNWKPMYGGALHLVTQEGKEEVLPFRHNSLAIFDVFDHKHHFVGEIDTAAGEEKRFTLGGWVSGSSGG